MKIFTNKKVVQKVIIAIIIVLSFNFIVPNFSQADLAGDIGGVLLGPVIDFIAAIGDAVLSALQYFMIDGNATSTIDTAGQVAGAAWTFLNPLDSFLVNASKFAGNEAVYGMEPVDNPNTESTDESAADVRIYKSELDTGWFYLGDYQIPTIKYSPEKIFSNQVPALDANFINPTNWEEQYGEEEGAIMNSKSVAQLLHNTIANWYVALRNLAIVALLSVLIYVGIRMVISSTSSDKAKYKQMLMDWVVALCIVFFLHYLMSFILSITGMITEGISDGSSIVVEVVKDDGTAETTFTTDLTGLCRLQLQYANLGRRMIYLIFYLALVIYTVMFTWTYVKRAITMAFLTLMAPLVAITYPIDKISDGKAQAFGIWLKEFIFNALLQPFHLIIYTIFLGASSEIAIQNPIYAILFLAFIIPAEKLLRRMFGFEKSSTAGAMGAAAGMLGGAAVLNTVKGALGKAGKGKSGSSGVRTKDGKKASGGKAPSFAESFGNGNSLPDGGDSEGGLATGGSGGGGGLPVSPGAGDSHDPNTNMQQRQSQATQTRNRNLQQGNADGRTWSENDTRGMGQWLGDLAKNKWNNSGLKGKVERLAPVRFARDVGAGTQRIRDKARAKINKIVPKPIRNTIRGAVGTIKKGATGAAKFAGKAAVGATFGLAAGIAGDDLEDVLKYGAAGTALGVTGLPIAGRAIAGAAGSLRDTYEQEAFGIEGAEQAANLRALMKDELYKEKWKDHLKVKLNREPTEREIRISMKQGAEYYNIGITDPKSIIKAVDLENELNDQFRASGIGEIEASERARNQAKTIAKWANDYDKKDLMDEKKVVSLRNQVVNQLVNKSGMGQVDAEAQANHVIDLIKKQKDLS